MHASRDLYDAQAGVVSRDQLLLLGATDNDIRRLVRRRELVRVHTGVYVSHTGPLSWTSRAWAAVLFHGGPGQAALCDVSALHLAGDPVHVAIEWPRRGTELPGVRLHRPTVRGDRVLWHLQPPRLRTEEAALDVAGAAPRLSDAVAVLTGVCQRRRTTPERLLTALERRSRTPRGAELRRVIGDIAFGRAATSTPPPTVSSPSGSVGGTPTTIRATQQRGSARSSGGAVGDDPRGAVARCAPCQVALRQGVPESHPTTAGGQCARP